MRFGGHETFPIREGWLYKGLRLLNEERDALTSDDAADLLGVGSNMAKSIRHWLLATGLARYTDKGKVSPATLEPTPLGALIGANDAFFTETGTWWALHLNLIAVPNHAFTWAWFFNQFTLERFERAVCLEALRRHLQMTEKRSPSPKTLERDVACFLACYARSVPPRRSDPEDVEESPFVELGILTHFRSSGWFEINRSRKEIPPELLGYSLSAAYKVDTVTDGFLQVPLMEALKVPLGPGRGFALSADSLFEMVASAEQEGSDQIRVSGLAGERTILAPMKPPLEWLRDYYRRISGSRQNAA